MNRHLFKAIEATAYSVITHCEHDLRYRLSVGQATDLLLDQEVVADLRSAQQIARMLRGQFARALYVVTVRDEDGTWFAMYHRKAHVMMWSCDPRDTRHIFHTRAYAEYVARKTTEWRRTHIRDITGVCKVQEVTS